MGKFKDKNGITLVGSFLRGVKDVAPDLLDLAGNITGVNALNVLADKIEGSDLPKEVKAEAKELLKHDLDAFAMEVEDRKDARSLYKSDDVAQKILAGLFTVAYFGVSYTLLNHFFNGEGKLEDYELGFISSLFGAMSSKVNTIIDFFFGGSVKK